MSDEIDERQDRFKPKPITKEQWHAVKRLFEPPSDPPKPPRQFTH